MSEALRLPLPDEPYINWAYSDASMQPYARHAVLAAVLHEKSVVQEAPVTSIAEAELLAAELAVLHALAHLPLRLHVDNPFVIHALTGRHGQGAAFMGLGERILALAGARGIDLEVVRVASADNRAHWPALSRYRSLEDRPRRVYELQVKGPLVRVRGNGVDFRRVYEAPAGFYAVCDLAEQLPAGVIAVVKGLMPMAWGYWRNPGMGGAQVKKRAKQALKVLAEKNSDIQLWKGDRTKLLNVTQ
ncbi:hypothetical protein DEIPH_ctg046orf0002 [Deinococcus phoenicis]|uniref:Uncharacterized protein n=1 Tax=Deinococcus phoenicis TaxID=1476583 RepID=A0A016QN63_9DEIO|nr:hypothetical protein [Deinococcus phoenicis]EYB67214.1 hypothetical protein DEIPH_ctg046orf0002 [Deinococcus phoenicis]